MPGVRDVIWTFRQGELSTLRTVCVPDASKLRDGVLTITFRSLKPHSPRHAGLAPVDLLLSFALRTMTLRYVRPGECGRPGSS